MQPSTGTGMAASSSYFATLEKEVRAEMQLVGMPDEKLPEVLDAAKAAARQLGQHSLNYFLVTHQPLYRMLHEHKSQHTPAPWVHPSTP